MEKLAFRHAWFTMTVSLTTIVFFTLSVAFLSHGSWALALFSAVLILSGFYCGLKYHGKKIPVDLKVMSLLNVSLLAGFLPKIGMQYAFVGVISPYFWLSLVTINMAYSMAIIIFYDMKISKI
ncbi:MAG: hypothetical protein HY516_00130 [Candidatus Aenigmarchaeota archaeon]|nr:hypothetical protein [Candidatus Aenigmarchaeota archaeon]